MKYGALVLAVACALVAVSGDARAELLDRYGGEAVYDDVNNLTWVANGNLAAGSSYDNGSSSTDGRMTYSNAFNWADNLVFGGVDSWRLPTTPFQDSTCSIQDVVWGGISIDYGGGATHSEMARLYAQWNGDPTTTLYNVQMYSTQPYYWSSSPFGGLTSAKFAFSFGGGSTTGYSVSSNHQLWAWAVTDGDVFGTAPPIPEPCTVVLVGLGVVGLGVVRRRRVK